MIELIRTYHQRTKHHYRRFASALGFLDWDNQPDPFLRFDGVDLLPLPIPTSDTTPDYDSLFGPKRTQPAPLGLESLSAFLYTSMALSAWKRYQDAKWSLRVNPSSGNLHPTETYILPGPAFAISQRASVWHYAPFEHGLEPLCEAMPPSETRGEGSQGLPGDGFLVGLTSVGWRESWKYGERAFRYCQLDAGHALAALRFSAAMLGWRCRLIGLSDEAMTAMLGLGKNRTRVEGETEVPEMLALVESTPHDEGQEWSPDPGWVQQFESAGWSGQPRPLSPDHHEWPLVDEAFRASRSTGTGPVEKRAAVGSSALVQGPSLSPTQAGTLVRSRRSAVAMDGETGMESSTLYRILARALPSLSALPWDAWDDQPRVHVALFVHRVAGLEPGLYFLIRDRARIDALKPILDGEFEWIRPPGCPDELPLFGLKAANVVSVAASLSCGQEIAGSGACAFAMLAELDETLALHGAHGYRRLYWESAMIGHLLYLEAEANRLRGTGIGCFFDDPVHQLLGIQDAQLQSLYHFTLGGPVEDARLATLPAYEHLRR